MSRALVTGGSRGLGASICQALESTGWQVLAPTRDELDLNSRESITAFIEGLDEPVTGLVLNAGVNEPNRLEQMTREQWESIQQINLGSAVQLVQGLAPRMAEAGGGNIVGISSLYSDRARDGRAAYSVSKAGIESLMRSVALEYACGGVLANCVAPGFLDTELTRRNNSPGEISALLERVPLRRLGSTGDVANVVSFLLSNENRYVTGQTIAVDGGFSIT